MAGISGLAKALSEPIRVRMFICLQGGPLSLHHFTEIFKMAPSTLSKHLHTLESAGLLVAVRHGRWRLYRWPGRNADPAVRPLLAWLRQVALEDSVLETDPAEVEGSEDEKKQVVRQVRDMLDEKIRDWLPLIDKADTML